MKSDGRHIRLLIGLGAAALLLLGRIFTLQIVNEGYKEDADRNATIYETIYPTRGVIYDRNGKLVDPDALRPADKEVDAALKRWL